eukprot:scaffold63390_cov23-Cyclotella_meneghiniana.AAC.1
MGLSTPLGLSQLVYFYPPLRGGNFAALRYLTSHVSRVDTAIEIEIAMSNKTSLKEWTSDSLHTLLGFADSSLASYLIHVASKGDANA